MNEEIQELIDNDLQIEWGREYSRDQARVLMAAHPGLLFQPVGGIHLGGHKCVGCRWCYPDPHDSEECANCGRPLVEYPRYWVSPYWYGDTVFYQQNGDNDKFVDAYAYKTDGTWVRKNVSPDCIEITAEEARQLRERVEERAKWRDGKRLFVGATSHNVALYLRCEKGFEGHISVDKTGEESRRERIRYDCGPMTVSQMESRDTHFEVTGLITEQQLLDGAGRERCAVCEGRGWWEERCPPVRVWCQRCDNTGEEPQAPEKSAQSVDDWVAQKTTDSGDLTTEERIDQIEARLSQLEVDNESR